MGDTGRDRIPLLYDCTVLYEKKRGKTARSDLCGTVKVARGRAVARPSTRALSSVFSFDEKFVRSGSASALPLGFHRSNCNILGTLFKQQLSAARPAHSTQPQSVLAWGERHVASLSLPPRPPPSGTADARPGSPPPRPRRGASLRGQLGELGLELGAERLELGGVATRVERVVAPAVHLLEEGGLAQPEVKLHRLA